MKEVFEITLLPHCYPRRMLECSSANPPCLISWSSQYSLNQRPADRKPLFAHERAVAWPSVEIGGARTLISGRHAFSSNEFFVQFMGS
jgi:hypothetical protein